MIKLQNSSYDTTQTTIGVRGPFRHMVPFQYQYPMGRIIVRSCEVSMQQDRLFKLSYRFGIEQAAQQQQCCWIACPLSKRSGNSKCKSREFETSLDVMIRRLTEYWNNHHTMARWNLINVIRFHWILLWGWNPIPAYPFLAYTQIFFGIIIIVLSNVFTQNNRRYKNMTVDKTTQQKDTKIKCLKRRWQYCIPQLNKMCTLSC